MKKEKLVVITAIVLIAIIIVTFLVRRNNTETSSSEETRGVAGEPMDVALDFYSAWKEAKSSTTTDPYAENLFTNMALSTELSEKIKNAETAYRENDEDPVLCRTDVPERLRSKALFEKDDSTKIMVFSKDITPVVQSVATLSKKDELWQITNIECITGEQDPNQGEFSFDREGYLLKSSLQPPLDNNRWHLVFEQDGTPGYTVPIFLSDTSLCALFGSAEETCREDMFFEGQKVNAKGNMTEAGLDVVKIEEVE